MADALWMRIREVDWERFPANGGANIPALLKNLASRKEPRAMKASQQLWTALCGGGQISAAAEHCIPFLIEILGISSTSIKDGIIDILSGIATSSEELADSIEPHMYQVRPLRRSRDAILADKAEALITLVSKSE